MDTLEQRFERTGWQSYRSFDELSDLQSQWDAIVDKGELPPDQDSRWLREVWCNVRKNRSLHIETYWHGQELLGIAPLVFETLRQKGISVQSIKPLHLYHQLRGSQVLVADKRAAPMFERLFQKLNDTSNDWHVMTMLYRRDEPQKSSFEKTIASRGYPYFVRRAHSSPYLVLADSWDAQFAQLSKKFRYELRTREKNIRGQGHIELRFLDTTESYVAGLRCIESIEAGSWKASGGLPITDPLHWNFYKRYAETAARQGTLRLPILFLDDEPIAFDYGVYSRGTYYLLQTSYKEKWGQHFPGSVLRKLVVEWLCGDQAKEVDLGPGSSIWKSKWTNTTRDYVVYTVFNRRIKSRYLYLLGGLAELSRTTALWLRNSKNS